MADLSHLSADDQRAIIEEVVRRVADRLAPGSSQASPSSTPTPTGATVDSLRAMAAGGVARFGTNGHATDACQTIASMIDHTQLKPNVRPEDIEKLCSEAREHHFASVCVNPTHVPLAAQMLHGTDVKICTVIGFPLGASSTETKAFETRQAAKDGAEEIDMVINVGLLRGGDFAGVHRDIEAVVAAAQGRTVKVILETSELTDDEKVAGCVLSKAAGAHFVKTSTGFSKSGATPEDVELMRRVVGPKMGVKASGGIRDCATAQEMIRRGATRLGVSASIAIVQGAAGQGGY